MRVIIDHDEGFNTLLVREYEIENCEEVTILATGNIKYKNVEKDSKSGGAVSKFTKTKESFGFQRYKDKVREKIPFYGRDTYNKSLHGPVPLQPVTSLGWFLTDGANAKFWNKEQEKKIVQNAFICAQVLEYLQIINCSKLNVPCGSSLVEQAKTRKEPVSPAVAVAGLCQKYQIGVIFSLNWPFYSLIILGRKKQKT